MAGGGSLFLAFPVIEQNPSCWCRRVFSGAEQPMCGMVLPCPVFPDSVQPVAPVNG